MGYTGEKKREYDRQWVARRKARFQEGQSCFMCGSVERLELDHRNPAEKVTHAIWSWAIPKLEAELAKCDWLCSDCHKLKTLIMDVRLSQHGTLNAYRVGCRCDPCRAVKSLDDNKRRSRS